MTLDSKFYLNKISTFCNLFCNLCSKLTRTWTFNIDYRITNKN